MSLIKLMARMGKETIAGHGIGSSTNNWLKIKAAYEKNRMQKPSVHALNLMTIHERNGTRGNGVGMGHRNKGKTN